MPPNLITSTEAGRRLGKSGKTVIRMAQKGLIPIAHQLDGPNGAYLFDAAVIDAILAKRGRATG